MMTTEDGIAVTRAAITATELLQRLGELLAEWSEASDGCPYLDQFFSRVGNAGNDARDAIVLQAVRYSPAAAKIVAALTPTPA